ncbi:MAG: tRNA threonylcarbamoyladenosine biosynthesis protein TsaB [Parasphingorhabdus sp.]|jgi:tRNA threonylcarbamoyladenosine biosynthesis protein TsaB
MKLLAIDSATEACSVALNIDGELTEIYQLAKNQHSVLLLDMVQNLLDSKRLQITDLDVIAYDQGPGSFTGIRIGAGVAQGLALSADLRVIGISSLQAMALCCPDGWVLPAIDARMRQVYWGFMRKSGDNQEIVIEESVANPLDVTDSVQQIMREGDGKIIAVGTGWDSYHELTSQLSSSSISRLPDFDYPRASSVAQLAQKYFCDHDMTEIAPAMPKYVRNKVTN